MINKETLEILKSYANKFAGEEINQNVTIGWYEDERKEPIYTKKCYDGDYPLTKGLRIGNKALVGTNFVVIKIDETRHIREVRFHDDSIIEILSGEIGYAVYKVRNKTYIMLRTPIFGSISECIKYFDNMMRKKNLGKYTMIISKCLKNNLITKKNNIYILNENLSKSIEKWCKIFSSKTNLFFTNEAEIFCNNFYSMHGDQLRLESIKYFIEEERKKNKFMNRSFELDRKRKNQIKIITERNARKRLRKINKLNNKEEN